MGEMYALPLRCGAFIISRNTYGKEAGCFWQRGDFYGKNDMDHCGRGREVCDRHVRDGAAWDGFTRSGSLRGRSFLLWYNETDHIRNIRR